MEGQQIVRIDGIKWWLVTSPNGNRTLTPLCPQHDLRMEAVPPRVYNSVRRGYINGYKSDGLQLECAEGTHRHDLPRTFEKEKQYVLDRIDAKIFKGMQVIDLDGELTPIAKAKVKSKDDKYFVTAQLMESKRGLQVVVYAGEKGKQQKTQIFIDPALKRLAFDHKDLHPNDVFMELKATFDDSSSNTLEKDKK